MSNKTKYFQNCLGVFQGGGCKGSAYVGAYKEAIKWGVSFSELVGTSAGSIIAVFIAAGATPAKLEELIKELDFKAFLSAPETLREYDPPKFAKIVKYIPLSITKSYHSIFTHLGLYNSNKLRKWVDDKLSELLPNVPKPIKFKDLIIPTSVIVTDIVTKKIEIYSKEKSYNKDVAEAVQCSCNLPFFFQPIEMRYLDGGILSNLPSFVFEDNTDKLYNRILAFSLEGNQEKENKIKDFMGFTKALLATTLDGNLDLQLALQDDLHIIKINTGDISSTDFDKITPQNVDFLIKQGGIAVNSFFKNEITNIHTRQKNIDISKDSFNTNNFITSTSDYKYKDIIIAEINTDWVYELFPTLLKWKSFGTNIQVILQEATDDPEHTKFRQRFLCALGVNVQVTSDIPFRGFIFDGNVKENCKAIIINKNMNSLIPYHSKLYVGEVDFNVIRLMNEKLEGLITNSCPALNLIILEKARNEELLGLMRDVKQYESSQIHISIKTMNVADLTFITKYVRGYKYRQIHNLYELFTRFGLQYFDSVKLNLVNNQYTLITPPVLEKLGDNFYVVEGNTRLTYAYRNGIENVECIVVEGVTEPLPSKGHYKVNEILLSDKQMVGDDRYEEFDYTKFRKIEKAVRNPLKCLIS